MESFLASRSTVTKLGSSIKNLSGGVFTPMGEKKMLGEAVPILSDGTTPVPEATQTLSGLESAGHKTVHPVRVEVMRENGSVERIVVHCKCGERIELDCLY